MIVVTAATYSMWLSRLIRFVNIRTSPSIGLLTHVVVSLVACHVETESTTGGRDQVAGLHVGHLQYAPGFAVEIIIRHWPSIRHPG